MPRFYIVGGIDGYGYVKLARKKFSRRELGTLSAIAPYGTEIGAAWLQEIFHGNPPDPRGSQLDLIP
jgi:hypothetical protein